jgi:hypothetical protein
MLMLTECTKRETMPTGNDALGRAGLDTLGNDFVTLVALFTVAIM